MSTLKVERKIWSIKTDRNIHSAQRERGSFRYNNYKVFFYSFIHHHLLLTMKMIGRVLCHVEWQFKPIKPFTPIRPVCAACLTTATPAPGPHLPTPGTPSNIIIFEGRGKTPPLAWGAWKWPSTDGEYYWWHREGGEQNRLLLDKEGKPMAYCPTWLGATLYLRHEHLPDK